MKKLLCVILSVILMLGVCTLPAGAEEVLRDGDIFIEGDFRCKVVNDAVSIVAYLGEYGEDVDVVVPETIQGYTVKYIGADAFGEHGFEIEFEKLQSVRLPDTIIAVGSCAFANLEADINLPSDLKYAFDYAFAENNYPDNLYGDSDTVLLPEGIEYLEEYAITASMVIVSESFVYTTGSPFGKIQNTDRVIGTVGSYADQYCQANRIDFIGYDYMHGDADQNGVVDVADIMGIKKAIMDEAFPTEYYDVDEDGVLDVADILACKNKIMHPNVATKEWLRSVWSLRHDISAPYMTT